MRIRSTNVNIVILFIICRHHRFYIIIYLSIPYNNNAILSIKKFVIFRFYAAHLQVVDVDVYKYYYNHYYNVLILTISILLILYLFLNLFIL